jgi:hypothetical protein
MEHQQQEKEDDWVAVIDANTSKTYYFHINSKQTTWEIPQILADATWIPILDTKSGRKYYFNRITKQSTWIQPLPDQTAREEDDKIMRVAHVGIKVIIDQINTNSYHNINTIEEKDYTADITSPPNNPQQQEKPESSAFHTQTNIAELDISNLNIKSNDPEQNNSQDNSEASIKTTDLVIGQKNSQENLQVSENSIVPVETTDTSVFGMSRDSLQNNLQEKSILKSTDPSEFGISSDSMRNIPVENLETTDPVLEMRGNSVQNNTQESSEVGAKSIGMAVDTDFKIIQATDPMQNSFQENSIFDTILRETKEMNEKNQSKKSYSKENIDASIFSIEAQSSNGNSPSAFSVLSEGRKESDFEESFSLRKPSDLNSSENISDLASKITHASKVTDSKRDYMNLLNVSKSVSSGQAIIEEEKFENEILNEDNVLLEYRMRNTLLDSEDGGIVEVDTYETKPIQPHEKPRPARRPKNSKSDLKAFTDEKMQKSSQKDFKPKDSIKKLLESKSSGEEEEMNSTGLELNSMLSNTESTITCDIGDIMLAQGNKNNPNFQLDLAHHRKGWLKRFFKIGGFQDQSRVLSFKKNLIHKSLLRVNRPNDKLAIEFFKHVMAFMGDRETSKDAIFHATALIAFGLGSPEPLRDEIFLQLCKQVTYHPKQSHAVKGWELLSVLSGAFTPSTQMKKFLEAFVNNTIRDELCDGSIIQLGKTVLERMEKCVLKGPRVEIPANEEIIADLQGRHIPISVYTSDGAERIIDVDCFLTVNELRIMLLNLLGIKFELPFNVIQANAQWEESLNPEIRILDAIASWKRVPKELHISGTERCRIVFRAQALPGSKDRRLLEDSAALKWIQTETAARIQQGKYPWSKIDYLQLGALQLQASQGMYDSSRHTVDWMIQALPNFFPSPLMVEANLLPKKKAIIELERYAEQVTSRWRGLGEMSGELARLQFLSLLDSHSFYGQTLYRGEQSSDKKFPCRIRLGVGLLGVEILGWGGNDPLECIRWSKMGKFRLGVGSVLIVWGSSSIEFRSESSMEMYRTGMKYLELLK